MSGRSQTVAAQRKERSSAASGEPKANHLRKRNWVYYVLPYLEFEASCRSCGSGNIIFKEAAPLKDTLEKSSMLYDTITKLMKVKK